MELTDNVKYVKGVGPNRAKLLNKLDIFTVKDLITYYPREYEDRSKAIKINEVSDGQECLIEGIVVSKINEIRTYKKNMTIYKLIVRDDTGTCELIWYNQPYLKTIFKLGQEYRFYGKVHQKIGIYEMNSPIFEEKGKSNKTGRIIPIYPLTYNLNQNTIRKIIENSLLAVKDKINESIPEYILKEYNLLKIKEAIEKIHFPNNFNEFDNARKRLVFEELLTMQLLLLTLKNKYKNNESGICFNKDAKMSDVINKLPFKLTKAQIRVLEEIDNDMESNKAMNRLLQGDVGSGKTVVAIIAAYKAVISGYQVAIMAPTSILASQHLESFKQILDKFNIKSELLIGNTTKKNKETILKKLKDGEIDILIGTHSLIEDTVVFKNLGLVITDEQHRFGVRQRSILSSKGKNPDVLVMTATPIPRTLALILYGDLDISIIDELPPNRKKIETYAVNKSMEQRIQNFIKKQVDEGRQAYIVCPLVEENEDIEAKSVIELFDKYQKEIFKDYRVAYMHGKLKQKEKDEIMQKFKDGQIDILISTTVIEVGVNVPNASIMVIENAERFGLAQLHQLRGRVGRGEYKSYCILVYQGNSELIRKRMQVMQDSNDGFLISEKDLELRGTGDFFGTKQHGIPDFKIANLFEDMPTLKLVQNLCIRILNDDPLLKKEKNAKLKLMIDDKYKNRIDL